MKLLVLAAATLLLGNFSYAAKNCASRSQSEASIYDRLDRDGELQFYVKGLIETLRKQKSSLQVSFDKSPALKYPAELSKSKLLKEDEKDQVLVRLYFARKNKVNPRYVSINQEIKEENGFTRAATELLSLSGAIIGKNKIIKELSEELADFVIGSNNRLYWGGTINDTAVYTFIAGYDRNRRRIILLTLKGNNLTDMFLDKIPE